MPTRSHTTEIATALRVVLDVALLNGAFCAAYWLRFYSPLTSVIPVVKGVPPFSAYVVAFPFATIVFLYAFKFFGSYAKRWRYEPMNEFFLVTRGMTAGMIALMAITFLLPSTHSETGIKYSRITFFMLVPLLELFLLPGRLVANSLEKALYRRSKERRRLLVIGTGETAARIARHIRRNPSLECTIVGFLKCEGEKSSSSRIVAPVLGSTGDFATVIGGGGVDEVVLTNPRLEHDGVMEMLGICEKNLLSFRHVPDSFEMMAKRVDVVTMDGVPLVGIHRIPLHYPWNRFRKRLFDIVGSSVGLVLSSPVIALAAAAIKLDSKGPVFYSQERCGEDGGRFHIYKLRTMVENAEGETGPVWARADDPRCTRVGAFLRRHNIDELPQLYNVLRGDMSLVGPRPERPHFVHRFTENIPRYMTRHMVRSGVTGWAQVNGLRGDTSIRARLRYDMYYLENWSILFDLKVIFMTIFARRNAY